MSIWRHIRRLAHWLALVLGVAAIAAIIAIITRPAVKTGAQPNFAGAELQSKRLAVFLDGTWNSVDSNTNVWRMRALCASKDAKGKPQLVYYSLGVNGFWGGVFGQGLDDNIRQAYEWLIENYTEGDEIYIFGFSRGAYTARALAGLIANDGVLKPGSPIGITELFERYKNPNADTIWALQDSENADPKSLSPKDVWLLKYTQFARVTMVGVWDTVGSLGISAGNIPFVSRPFFSYLQTGLRGPILSGFHALAVDEHREDFSPTLWDKRFPKDPNAVVAPPRPLSDVEQRWFVGAHANVGGGYPTDLLSQAPLRWIMKKAESKGLSFRSEVDLDGDALKEHVVDSYKSFGYGLYRWVSWWPLYRVIGQEPDVRDDGSHININETIDASVFERWRVDATYRPPNLIEWAQRKHVDPAQLGTSVRSDDPSV